MMDTWRSGGIFGRINDFDSRAIKELIIMVNYARGEEDECADGALPHDTHAREGHEASQHILSFK